jgi:peptidoglycan/LPS O-acetylase OafA/YrhL
MKSTVGRLQGLDALRGVAALLVMALHYEMMPQFVPPAGFPPTMVLWTQYGLMGVELFFVISGFVILMTLERAGSVLRFAINRGARLYPAYWLSLLVAGIFARAMHETSVTYIGINATMLQEFLGVPDIVVIYWTLSYELWFYASLALIAAIGLLRRVDYLALAWFAMAIAMHLAGAEPLGLGRILTMWQFGHLFIAGMMVYLIASGRASTPAILALALSVGYSLIGRWDPWVQIPGAIYCAINGAFIAVVYLAAINRLPAPLWLARIGKFSYSLYLLHLPIGIMLTRAATALGISRWFAVALALPTALAAAYLSYSYVERPGQRRIRDGLERFATAAPTFLRRA